MALKPKNSISPLLSRSWFNQLFTFATIYCLTLQHCLCEQHHLPEEIFSKDFNLELKDVKPPPDKRLVRAEDRAGKLDEIFNGHDNIESNYDEYPMIVPKKRADLLLDRLMATLHDALEKKHNNKERINEFYNKLRGHSKNLNNEMPPHLVIYSDDKHNDNNNDDDDGEGNVIMDYDFKDLNSINRATGQTLMAQNFQRRSNMGMDWGRGGGIGGVGVDGDGGVALFGKKGAGRLISGSGGVGVGVRAAAVGNTNGRPYWRCYFNAVSCF